MKIEYIISGFALIISIVFGIIASIASHKTNNLQNEVLSLRKQANEFEIKKGEILLMSLIGSYFVIQINCWEPTGKMRTDKISMQQYIDGLKQLNKDVNNLIVNPFYIDILEKYPEINLLWISLRRAIIEREQEEKMAVNPQTFNLFYDLYFKIKNEVDDKNMLKKQFYIAADESAEFLKKELPKLKQIKPNSQK